jgi:hypothetical protein
MVCPETSGARLRIRKEVKREGTTNRRNPNRRLAGFITKASIAFQ